MTTKAQLDLFYELSSVLTGFERIDLIGTGVGQEYLDALVQGTSEKHVKDLLATAKKVGSSSSAMRKEIWDDDRFGPMARSVVLMWYLGSWYPLPAEWHAKNHPDAAPVHEYVVSAVAYQEALWAPAVGAHPRGAKPPGFGSWGEPPGSGSASGKRSGGTRTAKRKTTK